jgi:hypothetical protein
VYANANASDQRPARGGSEFRRVRLGIDGEAAGWGYRAQLEMSGSNVDLRDANVERELGRALLTLGQFKPFRSMEELTSSNDLGAMERGFASGTGIFAQRQRQQGIGLLQPLRAGGIGISAFSLREDNTPRSEGWGSAARATAFVRACRPPRPARAVRVPGGSRNAAASRSLCAAKPAAAHSAGGLSLTLSPKASRRACLAKLT